MSDQLSVATSVLFLLAILLIGALSLNVFKRELKEVLVAHQDTLVDRIADDLDQKFLTLQRALVATAKTVVANDVSTANAAQEFLDSNAGLHALFDRSTFLFSPEGTLIAEFPFKPGRRGSDFAFRGYIKDTVKTRQPVISEPFVTTKDDHDTVLMLTAPVFSADGKLIAILTGSLGLTRPAMLGQIAKTIIGKTGYLYLVTAEGKLIMHPDTRRLLTRAYVPNENSLFERALRGFEGTEGVTEADGTKLLTSYKRLALTGWVLGARYPDDEAFAAFKNLVWRSIELLTIACVLLLAAVWWLTHGLLKPLVLLTRQLKQSSTSEGRVSTVHLGAKGEVGDLEHAFNDLAYRLREREDTLIDTMESYQMIADNSTDLITKHTTAGVVTFSSAVCQGILGIPCEDMVGRYLMEFVHPKDRESVKNAFREVASHAATKTVTYRMRRSDHQYLWFETTLRLMGSRTGNEAELLCISRNISERKRMEDHLYDLARRDALTNLPNRLLLEERVANALADAYRDRLFAGVLVIDLDRFKNINDTLGHTAGDTLLKQAAARLKTCVRPSDTVSRWGGDEFVVLLPALPGAETAIGVANRCLEALRLPFPIDGQSLHISTSIGISLFPESGNDAEALIKNADTAMYRAKAQGGDCFVIYANEMNAEAQTRLTMENALHFALERNQLSLHYQPFISAKTGRIVAVEALLRWRHPELGWVSPVQFIPIAEATGLVGKIGEWVLQKACAQMAEWRTQGLAPMRLSVNLSSRQFRKDSLVKVIRAVLEESGLEPNLLELEITETLLMDDVKKSSYVIKELKSIGAQLSVDDFGTGYSSLSYLKRFPLDVIKIDRSFVKDLITNDNDAAIVLATVALAKSLQLKTVAEGVETKEQAAYLIKAGCDELQGYLFSKPLPPADFLSFALASPTFLVSKIASAS
jgi:diguanylate cyclase (GGDEF)-like protein/PAS domain S-box-containing protein